VSQAQEIIELDCRGFWKKGQIPPEVEEDLKRCNVIWVSSPAIPSPSQMHLDWKWQWRPWEWRVGPSLPPQAKFDAEVEIEAGDHDLNFLRERAERALIENLKPYTEGVEFALFLCIREKYTQGLALEEDVSLASLKKTFVLLGRKERG